MGKWCVSWDLMKVFLLLLYCIILIHKKIYVFFLLNLRLKFMWGYRQIRFLCPYKDVLLWGLCNDQWAPWTLSKALCICRKHVSGWRLMHHDGRLITHNYMHTALWYILGWHFFWYSWMSNINSLAPGRSSCNLELVIFKLTSWIDRWYPAKRALSAMRKHGG